MYVERNIVARLL